MTSTPTSWGLLKQPYKQELASIGRNADRRPQVATHPAVVLFLGRASAKAPLEART